MEQGFFATGENVHGELGIKAGTLGIFTKGPKDQKILPISIISNTWQSTLFVNRKGTIFQYGARGENTFTLPSKIQEIKAGTHHFIILTQDGKVYGLGKSDKGQCGSNNNEIKKPSEIVWFTENNISIKQIACGFTSSYFITKENKLYSLGDNTYGALGKNHGNSKTPLHVADNVKRVFADNVSCHFLYITNDGDLYGAGYNNHKQICDSTQTRILTPVKISMFCGKHIKNITLGLSHTVVWIHENSQDIVYSIGIHGSNGLGQEGIVGKFTEIKELRGIGIKNIAVGEYQNLVLTNDNELWVWGKNTFGQLGNSTDRNTISKPKKIVIDGLSKLPNPHVHCGPRCSWIFSKAYDNIISEEFKKLYELKQLCDIKIKNHNAHKSIIEFRTNKKIDQVTKILNEYTENQVDNFFKWVYGEMYNINNQTLKSILNKLEILNPQEKTLESDLLHAFDDEDSKDFIILVPDEEDPEYFDELKVHKFILFARCGLFRDMFRTVNEEQNTVKDFSGKSIESLELFLQYLYTNKISLTADHDPILVYEELEDSAVYYQLNKDSNFSHELNKIKK
ncbi:hypothetical protein M0812_17551 [Anaeramoeba flamelloides]|uniref:BTB domain-containing protein n=1 Tax=Anaeramoeba flamelloides TaxID=1746091 RepID=A0AAV7ZB65_9EUKA|nr:hypothetical protein M0812_17551 [Anaeramoeba flamelloides]